MTVIGEMADFVSGSRFSMLPRDTVEHVKMHLLDTIGAMLVGTQTREGVAIEKLMNTLTFKGNVPIVGYKAKTDLLPSVIAGCAATRSTEMDDINLKACVTPGAIIVPTAFSLANAGYLSEPKEFLLAVAIGYDMIIRLGMAIDGPIALYKGIWPTHLVAALGGATVAARALKLNSQQTASAISTALTMSTGIEGRIRRDAPFTRWLTASIAAQDGVISALAAREGFVADESFLDEISERTYGHKFSQEKITDGMGKRFCIDETGMKPYPVGRQGLSAIEAFREILATHQVDPESIEEIIAWVPKWFPNMISRPRLPENRLSSLGVHYQMALAAFAPQKIFDPKRENMPLDSRFNTLIQKVTVKPSRDLMQYYPAAWPARVEVKAKGRRYSCKMLHPKGDADNRLTWEEVVDKYMRIAKPTLGKVPSEQAADMVKKLDSSTSLAQLLKLLT